MCVCVCVCYGCLMHFVGIAVSFFFFFFVRSLLQWINETLTHTFALLNNMTQLVWLVLGQDLGEHTDLIILGMIKAKDDSSQEYESIAFWWFISIVFLFMLHNICFLAAVSHFCYILPPFLWFTCHREMGNLMTEKSSVKTKQTSVCVFLF